MTLTPREWDVLTGQVGRSDDLANSLKEALDNGQRFDTVPVTQETSDGAKRVVGHAQLYTEGNNILATFTIQSASLSKHLGGTLGPFSISAEMPNAARKTDDDLIGEAAQAYRDGRYTEWLNQEHGRCYNDACTYQEPHQHGFACTSGCSCNRHGRVD
jgi:hypothetical protein